MKAKYFLLTFLFLFASCKEALLHDLTEVEANRYIGILHAENIEADKEVQSDLKWTLNVEKKDFIKAISLLDSKRLLKEKTSLKKEGSGLLGSNQEKDFFHERALSAELEKTLLTLNGVYEARVHLNLQKDDILNLKTDEEKQESAGVLMVVSDQEKFDEDKIKAIIAGASGINKENVSIVISKIAVKEEKNDAKEKLVYLSKPSDVKDEKESVKEEAFTFPTDKVLKYLKPVGVFGAGILVLIFLTLFFKRKFKSKKLNLIKTISVISR